MPPKQPPPAVKPFQIYFCDHVDECREKAAPGTPDHEIAKAIATGWTNLPEAKVRAYEQIAQAYNDPAPKGRPRKRTTRDAEKPSPNPKRARAKKDPNAPKAASSAGCL